MNSAKLEYPVWQQPLMAVVLEFDSKPLREKFQKLEAFKSVRFNELEGKIQALNDGFITIRLVNEQRLGNGGKK
jgi:hypothetical protein